ncbi:probable pectinesterase 29 [Manihot esculenta]|nr:probable pectinesterase 29 [Manihot esculenta]
MVLLLHCSSRGCKASDCQPNTISTITVDISGHGNFTSVQSAIDFVPEGNTQWIRIQISPGKYSEKVAIPVNKSCIFLDGAGRELTSIEWGDHEETHTSATFTSYPDNIVAKGIKFKNTYNLPDGLNKIDIMKEELIWKQAVAARILGDKCAFYECGFVGLQDTLWDEEGRHYFNSCYIEGSVDFIFGQGQSIYEGCEISVNIGRFAPGVTGYITAQRKQQPQDSNGFVFKNCNISGTGTVDLGRAWGPYSTVVFYNSTMSDVIAPEGWNAWNFVNHEANFTYVEEDNKGPGADTSKRVPWEKKLDPNELQKFLNMSYVDEDGWLSKTPDLTFYY